MKKLLFVAFASFVATGTALADSTYIVEPVVTKNQIISSVEPSYELDWNVRVVDDIYKGDRIDFEVAPTFLEEFGNIRVGWEYSLNRLNCEEVTAKHLSCVVTSEYPAIVNAKFVVADRDNIQQYVLKTDSIKIIPKRLSAQWLRDTSYRTPWYRYTSRNYWTR